MDDVSPAQAGLLMSIDKHLEEMLAKTRSDCIVIIDKNGLFLHGVGNLEIVDMTALAALVAGAHAATLALIRLLGEDRISILFQQGDRYNIQVSLVGEEAMMVIIFREQAKIGLVRLHADRTIRAILPLIVQEEETAGTGEIDLDKFKEYATNLIDRILKE